MAYLFSRRSVITAHLPRKISQNGLSVLTPVAGSVVLDYSLRSLG
jgi:hypothetical protein